MSTDEFLGWCHEKPTILAFTAKAWCGHCKPLEPEWVKIREVSGIHVHFLQCDASDATKMELRGKKLEEAFHITNYPTILVFSPKLKKWFSYTDSRTADKIVHFARTRVAPCCSDHDANTSQLREFRVDNPLLLSLVNHQNACISRMV